jgi:hypothetical protein
MANQIFVNLPVKDLERTKEFFSKLGFTFNPQFTDQNAACMIIGENIYAMLLVEKFFRTFTADKEISDARRSTEVLNALSVDSREDVDEMVEKAIEAGGREFRESQDYGWMYGRALEDLDGHIWEVLYMDKSRMPEEMTRKGEAGS